MSLCELRQIEAAVACFAPLTVVEGQAYPGRSLYLLAQVLHPRGTSMDEVHKFLHGRRGFLEKHLFFSPTVVGTATVLRPCLPETSTPDLWIPEPLVDFAVEAMMPLVQARRPDADVHLFALLRRWADLRRRRACGTLPDEPESARAPASPPVALKRRRLEENIDLLELERTRAELLLRLRASEENMPANEFYARLYRLRGTDESDGGEPLLVTCQGPPEAVSVVHL